MSSPAPPAFVWPPLGESTAAAAICAAVFLSGALACVANMRRTTYRLYMIGGALAATFRGVSLALKASSAHNGTAGTGESIIVPFFAGAGFGIAIAVQMLVIGGWLRNTADDAKPSFWRPLRLVLFAVLFPTVIVFGPIIGLAGALVLYVNTPPSADAVDTSTKLREASGTSLLIVTCLNALLVLLCLWTSIKARGGFSLKRHASHTIVWLVPGTLFLVWAAAYRVQGQYVRPWTLSDEALLYPLQVLPEMLQLLLVWCVPALAARIHLSDRFQVWWAETHPDGPEFPLLGGFATEPQPPPSWAQADGAKQQHGPASPHTTQDDAGPVTPAAKGDVKALPGAVADLSMV